MFSLFRGTAVLRTNRQAHELNVPPHNGVEISQSSNKYSVHQFFLSRIEPGERLPQSTSPVLPLQKSCLRACM